jgi:hypothetical protein
MKMDFRNCAVRINCIEVAESCPLLPFSISYAAVSGSVIRKLVFSQSLVHLSP